MALVRVVDSKPQVLDYLTYSGVSPGFSYGDYPDGQPFNRVIMRDATPGSTNVSRPFNLYINEWLAGNTNTIADPADGKYQDWFEIYNPGTNAVDLGGLWFGDSSSSRFQVPTNGQYQVPAGGYLLVWADNETSQNNTNRTDLHVNFQLSKTADSITLYASDKSTIIDSVSFTNQIDDISEGRYPDGTLNILSLTNTTPRAANSLSARNTPPQLASIGDRTIRLGQTVSFSANGSDTDTPAQTLAYALDAGAPLGASINAQSGLFVWTPAGNQTPSTNAITVRVTDNGAPPLSASQNFTIIALLPPRVSITHAGGGNITLSFDTVAGRTYEVRYKDNLGDPEWLLLNPAVVAPGTTLTAMDNINANPQRFYRIVQVN